MIRNQKSRLRTRNSIFCILCSAFFLLFSGCGGYSGKSLYQQDVKSVYVEMFDNTTFWRDLEYDLTDAIAKRIESDTPYKIISDRSKADTVLSGKITGIDLFPLTLDPESGRPLEDEAEVTAQFTWKNLKTGQYLVQSSAAATTSFSTFQQQGHDYAFKVAANKLAERIVEQMQMGW